MSERFYTNSKLAKGLVTVTGPEASHMFKVCRLRANDPVYLFNGDGNQYYAIIQSIDRAHATLEIQTTEYTNKQNSPRLEIASALPKGDRLQFLIEKLTELNVNRFIPLRTERSVVHPREAKQEKMERYVIEACKQSGRNRLMAIDDMQIYGDWCKSKCQNTLRLLMHPGLNTLGDFMPTIESSVSKVDAIIVAIGPEGGFSDEEVIMAKASGWIPVSMQGNILRIETAAVAVASILINTKW